MGSDHRCEDLAEDLSVCRAELAAARRQQEELAEELARLEQQQRGARARLRSLATAIDQHLATHAAPGLRSRVRRRLERRDPEAELVALLRSSDLFDGPWYLQQHPGVIKGSLDAARHYLRHGAGSSWDPSPRFSTRDYLQQHPEVAASGENPLVAHLRANRARKSGAADA